MLTHFHADFIIWGLEVSLSLALIAHSLSIHFLCILEYGMPMGSCLWTALTPSSKV